MSRFWLDANVLIEANNRSYPINRAVTFWSRLAEQVELGSIACTRRVYKEVAEHEQHQDAVANWIRVRKDKLRITPPRDVQKLVGEIGQYLFNNTQYDVAETWAFCRGGDPWVVAHAKIDNGVVVTHESALRPQAKKPRVPDVCRHFEVQCVDVLRMFELLDITF